MTALPIIPENGEVTVLSSQAIALRAELHQDSQEAATGQDLLVLNAVDMARTIAESAPQGWLGEAGVHEHGRFHGVRRYQVVTLYWEVARRGRWGKLKRMIHPHGAAVLVGDGVLNGNCQALAMWDPRQPYIDAEGKVWEPTMREHYLAHGSKVCVDPTFKINIKCPQYGQRKEMGPAVINSNDYEVFALDAPKLAQQIRQIHQTSRAKSTVALYALDTARAALPDRGQPL